MQSKVDEPRGSMRKGRPEARTNRTYREYTVTLAFFAIHLDVVVAPFLDFAYGERCLHEPCQKGIEYEYDLNRGYWIKYTVKYCEDLPQNRS